MKPVSRPRRLRELAALVVLTWAVGCQVEGPPDIEDPGDGGQEGAPAVKILREPTLSVSLFDAPAYRDAAGNIGGMIAYDVNGDRAMDLLITQEGMIRAVSTNGSLLWTREVDIQISVQSETNGLPGWDGPGIQAADIDGDGNAEVLYLTQSGQLHIAAAATGELIREVTLAAPTGTTGIWEHLVVADFRGEGDRDLLLQASNAGGYRMGRYLAAFSLDELRDSDAPQPLWTLDDFPALAHGGARVVDLDQDGRDEVVSAGVVGPDGNLVHRLPVIGNADNHVDAVYFADVLPDRPGLEVLATEETNTGGGNRVFLFGKQGLIWETHYEHQEPQNAAIGDFVPERPGLEIWCRSRNDVNQVPFMFDSRGQLLGSYQLADVAPEDWPPAGLELINTIQWTGSERPLLAAKARHEAGDVAIVDAMTGAFVARLPIEAARLYVADVVDDWREEIVVLNGSALQIYANDAPNEAPAHPSLWEDRHYRRAKQTWNYYSP